MQALLGTASQVLNPHRFTLEPYPFILAEILSFDRYVCGSEAGSYSRP